MRRGKAGNGYWIQYSIYLSRLAVKAKAAGSFKAKDPAASRGTGYVVDCLEAALWAFHRSESFRKGALLAVNLGDNADTTGAVYGQLAGASYGELDIPEEWLRQLLMAMHCTACQQDCDIGLRPIDPEPFMQREAAGEGLTAHETPEAMVLLNRYLRMITVSRRKWEVAYGCTTPE